jgi:hypothetical protein
VQKILAFGLTVAVLSGCATAPPQYHKEGATQGEFAQTKYQCLQESQQSSSGSTSNPWYGSSESEVITNHQLYRACMNAHGWYLQSAGGEQHSTVFGR